jgi:hypothetical protein
MKNNISQDNVVIVIDAGNYIKPESVPFKAIVKEKFDNEIIVESIATGKLYELYYNQILEYLEIEEIAFLLDLSKFGDYDLKYLNGTAQK